MKVRPVGQRNQLQIQIRPSRQRDQLLIQIRPLKASDSVSDQFSQDQLESESKTSRSVQFKPDVSISSSSQCTLALSRSSINIDSSLREKISSLLQTEILYREILEEMESTEKNEIIQGKENYKLQKKLLMIHVIGEPEEVQYWRVVVLDDLEVKSLLVSELRSVPYSAHPGGERTIGKVKRSFWWKGMAGDIREFVESCPTCQLEKTDHILRKGSLWSLTLPEVKWQEVNIDFVTDLPALGDTEDSIMTVVDRATKMVHLIPWKKTNIAGEAARLY